ncbi:MAG: SGNH/GDSL hydrolase family protein [Clostridia bacterium]|nr:SGNH/GDSL hydrolase family protein [Clostridia bacterium]
MKIVFFGDSITDAGRNREQLVSNTKYGCGYVTFAVAKLCEKYFDKYEVVNRGIAGECTKDLLNRFDSDIVSENPDILTILVGANDFWFGLDLFEERYEQIIAQIKEKLPNVKVILMQPFVLKGFHSDSKNGVYHKIRDYAKIVDKIAKKYAFPYVELQAELDNKAQIYGESAILYDGIHPNTYGAKVIADKWFEVFEKSIEK